MSRLVIVAPGRGSYNRSELGYFNRFEKHPRAHFRRQLLDQADRLRGELGRTLISELDGREHYSPSLHLPGENASPLIFAAGAADYDLLDSKHQIEAVLGNSMGWYTTLYTGGALPFSEAFRVMDTMGWYQKGNLVGGQIIYPLIDDQWRRQSERIETVRAIIENISARGPQYWVGESIHLGGLTVLAGTDQGIRALLDELPKVKLGANEYPFQLARHGAFHTRLMADASHHGLSELADLQWQQPKVPMIDGRGHVWRPYQASAEALRDYTLNHQVCKPYDFTASVRVALREFNPDHLVLLGPGETLGGAIAQVMISEGWRGLHSKQDFSAAQRSDKPLLIAMNRPEQARLII